MNGYGTHAPMLQAIFKLARPRRAVEIGMGQFSTTAILGGCDYVISVEHDRGWFDQVVAGLVDRSNFDPQFSDFPETTALTLLEDTKAETLAAFDRFWADFARNSPGIDFLFVDGYVAERHIALRHLYAKSDIIVIHDTDAALYRYEPELAVAKAAGYRRCSYRGHMPWTDCVVSPSSSFDIDALVTSLPGTIVL